MEYMKAIVNELSSRVKNIRIYHPFFTFYNEGSKIDSFDMPVLLLSVLSFLMYEGRLKSRTVSFAEIKDFITEFLMTAYNYNLKEENSVEFTRRVIEKLDDSYTYSYLKPLDNNKNTYTTILVTQDEKTLEFTITKDGLDFLLKTKEFGDEAQISINLLLFKKQIESGSFSYAYEIVRRLNIEVQKRIEEKVVILNMVLNGGTQGTEEYKRYWDRISNQFSEEEGIFRDTVHFLRDFYSNEVERNKLNKEDVESLKDLPKIEMELVRAQSLHTKLIGEVLSMSNDYENILDIKMKSAFTEKFEFERMMDKGCKEYNDMRVLGAVLKPLYGNYIRKTFSFEKIFEPQRVFVDEEKIVESYESNENEDFETIDRQTKRRVEHNYLSYIKLLMFLLLKKQKITLDELIDFVRDSQADDYIFNIDFVPFLSKINHLGRVNSNPYKKEISFNNLLMKDDQLQNDIEEGVYQVITNDDRFKDYKYIRITSIPDEDIVIDDIIKVTNMIFDLE